MDDYSNSSAVSNGKEGMGLRNTQNLVIKLEILGPWENEVRGKGIEGNLAGDKFNSIHVESEVWAAIYVE